MPWFVWTFTNRLCWPRTRPPRTPVMRSSDGLEERGVLSSAEASPSSGTDSVAPPTAPAAPALRNERRDLSSAIGPSLPGPLLQQLLDLRPRHRQLVDVVVQPLREVPLHRVAPALVDLARRVDAFLDPLEAEHVAQLHELGGLADELGELRRDADHALALGEH